MHTQDPIYYYFIVPLILLVIQLIGLLLYIKCKGWFIARAKQLQKLCQSDDKDLYILTRKEQQMQAEANEQQRMANNHSKLTRQGENDE